MAGGVLLEQLAEHAAGLAAVEADEVAVDARTAAGVAVSAVARIVVVLQRVIERLPRRRAEGERLGVAVRDDTQLDRWLPRGGRVERGDACDEVAQNGHHGGTHSASLSGTLKKQACVLAFF